MGLLSGSLTRLPMRCRVIGTVVRFIVVIGACAVATALPNAHAQSLSQREYEIKAAFLYNFIKFIDWPAQALPESSDTMTICVLGEDPFGEAIESIKDKPAKGKRLSVRRIQGVKELTACHVLFVGSSEEKRLPQVMQSVQGLSVLTVGEMDEFVRQGGIINFVIEKNKVRFQINVDNASRAGLKLSSQLLSLAKVVRQ